MRVSLLDCFNLGGRRCKSKSPLSDGSGCAHLGSVIALDSSEDSQQHLVNYVDDFVIVVLNRHFQIQSGKLGQMAVGVRVLRAKYGSDLKYALHVGRDGHLLGELRGLREEGGMAEVVDFEDRRAGFGAEFLELRRVDFDEPGGDERLSEERAYGRVDAEDRLVDRGLWGIGHSQ